MADPVTLTPALLADLEAKARAATAGPWAYDDADTAIEGPNGGALAYVAEHANLRTVQATGEPWRSADGRYIAAVSPEVVLALVEAVARLRKVELHWREWSPDRQELPDDLRLVLDAVTGRIVVLDGTVAGRTVREEVERMNPQPVYLDADGHWRVLPGSTVDDVHAWSIVRGADGHITAVACNSVVLMSVPHGDAERLADAINQGGAVTTSHDHRAVAIGMLHRLIDLAGMPDHCNHSDWPDVVVRARESLVALTVCESASPDTFTLDAVTPLMLNASGICQHCAGTGRVVVLGGVDVEGATPPGEVSVPGILHGRDWCKRHGGYVEDDAPYCSICGSATGHNTVEKRRWRIACPPSMAPDWFNGLVYRKIDTLELSTRADKGLSWLLGCTSVADVVCLTESDVLRAKNVGVKSLADLRAELARLGLSLGMGRHTSTPKETP